MKHGWLRKKMPSQTSIVNKFVLNFLRSRKVTDDVVDAWEEKNIQSNLKKTIKKQRLVHPKGIINPYIFFCRDERGVLLAEQPHLTMKELACLMGPRWVALKESTRPEDVERIRTYEQMYEDERKRYNDEKRIQEPAKSKKEPQINTAYKAFCDEKRKAGSRETIVELNNKWKTVRKDVELLARYNQLAGKV